MASKEDSGEEIETSKEAAEQGKNVLISLINKLIAVAQEYEKKLGNPEQKLSIKDVLETLGGDKREKGKSNMVQVFSNKLSLVEKLQFSRGWASSSDAERMISGFYERSKLHWKKIEEEDDKFFLGDVHLFKDIPESGALVIKEFWNKEGLLSKENKSLVFKHFKDMIHYAKMWNEIVKEEEGEEREEGDHE